MVPAPHVVFAVAECGNVAPGVDQAAAASRSAQFIDRTIHRKAFGDTPQIKMQAGMLDHAARFPQFKVTQSSVRPGQTGIKNAARQTIQSFAEFEGRPCPRMDGQGYTEGAVTQGRQIAAVSQRVHQALGLGDRSEGRGHA
jgi:hypothetical protein